MAIRGFIGNPFDGNTIEQLFNQMKTNELTMQKELAYDRGRKGKPEINGVKIIIPSPPQKTDTNYQKSKKRRQCRTRAAIEPIISHLKHDYRLLENYFWGENGVQINALMAGAARNFKKYMEVLKEKLLWLIVRFMFQQKSHLDPAKN